MNITVIGTGYVGLVSALGFAQAGHKVIGIDIDKSKLELLKKGEVPFFEQGLQPLLKDMLMKNQFTVRNNLEKAVLESNAVLICVGTPSDKNGDIDSTAVKRVFIDLARIIKKNKEFLAIIVRSTIMPDILKKIIKEKFKSDVDKDINDCFGISFHPEFLREGSAIQDFINPPFTIASASNTSMKKVLIELYKPLGLNMSFVSIEEAALIKYASNIFHALKISFTNEIGRLSHCFKADSLKIMQLFSEDRILNIAPTYLRPGFAFGGSCLPKDLRAALSIAKQRNINLPLFKAIEKSNDSHISKAVQVVLSKNVKQVGFLGITFKTDTDDLRESPYLRLAKLLFENKMKIHIYDKNVNPNKLHGANMRYVENILPQFIDCLEENVETICNKCNLLIVCHNQYLNLVSDKMLKQKIVLTLNPNENTPSHFLRIV